MSNKVHPMTPRMGVTKDWLNSWCTSDLKLMSRFIIEGSEIDEALKELVKYSTVVRYSVKRPSINFIQIVFHAFDSSVLLKKGFIGRVKSRVLPIIGAQKLEVLISEADSSRVYASTLANQIARTLEKNKPYRKCLHQFIRQAKEGNASGARIKISGRINGVELSRDEKASYGVIPRQNFFGYDLDYYHAEANMKYGVLGVSTWICYKIEQQKRI